LHKNQIVKNNNVPPTFTERKSPNENINKFKTITKDIPFEFLVLDRMKQDEILK